MRGYTGIRHCPPDAVRVYGGEAGSGRRLAVRPVAVATRRSRSSVAEGVEWTLPPVVQQDEAQDHTRLWAPLPEATPAVGQSSTAVHPGRITAVENLFGMGTMEQVSQGSTDDQQQQIPAERDDRSGDNNIHTGIMDRERRSEAMAWVQAYRLIRGGVVDEVVEFIEGSQYTIELLVQMLSEAACRKCEPPAAAPPEPCDFCQRRGELLSQLT